MNGGQLIRALIPHNSDAAFKSVTNVPKPSDLLLHYNYGAAAVKTWGHGTEVLRDNAQPPRPPPPARVEMGPSRSTHDRTAANQKRDDARNAQTGGGGNATAGPSRTTRSAQKRDTDGLGGGNAVAGPGIERIVDSEGQASWDEDDVIWSSGGKMWVRFQSDSSLISVAKDFLSTLVQHVIRLVFAHHHPHGTTLLFY